MDTVRGNRPGPGVAFRSWPRSWESLGPLVQEVLARRKGGAAAGDPHAAGAPDPAAASEWQERYRSILESLRTPR